MKKILFLSFFMTTLSYCSDLPRFSLIPLQAGQALNRSLTHFEEKTVKTAAQELEKMFKEQEQQEAEVDLLSLPYAAQIEFLAGLTQNKLLSIADRSSAHKDLVEKYQQETEVVDLSNESEITTELFFTVSQSYPNLKKLIIWNPNIESCLTLESLLLILRRKSFPKLEYLKLLNHIKLLRPSDAPRLRYASLKMWAQANSTRELYYGEKHSEGGIVGMHFISKNNTETLTFPK